MGWLNHSYGLVAFAEKIILPADWAEEALEFRRMNRIPAPHSPPGSPGK
jgi:hypothetical protein